MATTTTVLALRRIVSALMKLSREKAIQSLIKVKSERPYESSVVPRTRIRIVSKVGKVKDLGAIFHGVKDFSGEMWIAVLKDTEDENERFESNDPITSLADSFGDGLSARGGVGLIGGDGLEDLRQVTAVNWDFVMGSGFQDGEVEVDGVAAIGGACDLG